MTEPTTDPTTEPLRIAFEVACSIEHAFTVWTANIATWWPTDHTMSGAPDTTVVLEAGVGGRIYERTRDGVELDWGVVTTWTPPARLAYRWHLGRSAKDATDVEITFRAHGSDGCRIEIEHRGWEQLAAEGVQWRRRNQTGWDTLLPHVQAAMLDHDTFGGM